MPLRGRALWPFPPRAVSGATVLCGRCRRLVYLTSKLLSRWKALNKALTELKTDFELAGIFPAKEASGTPGAALLSILYLDWWESFRNIGARASRPRPHSRSRWARRERGSPGGCGGKVVTVFSLSPVSLLNGAGASSGGVEASLVARSVPGIGIPPPFATALGRNDSSCKRQD